MHSLVAPTFVALCCQYSACLAMLLSLLLTLCPVSWSSMGSYQFLSIQYLLISIDQVRRRTTASTSGLHNIWPAGRLQSRVCDLPQCFLKDWPVWCFRLIFLKILPASNGSIPVHSKVGYFRWFSIIRHTISIGISKCIKVHHFHFFSWNK